jgi:Uma2 family endonuclease
MKLMQRRFIMSAMPKQPPYTLEAYVELEAQTGAKYHYEAGKVYLMAGGSPNHSRLQRNVVTALYARLRGTPCEVHGSDLRLGIPFRDTYTYPDASVVCGQAEYAKRPKYTLLNPILLVEVLSPSTAAYDMNEKFALYRHIPSFETYLLLSQDRVRAMLYRKTQEGWLLHVEDALEATLTLALGTGIALPMQELYDGVVFDSANAELGTFPYASTQDET